MVDMLWEIFQHVYERPVAKPTRNIFKNTKKHKKHETRLQKERIGQHST